MDGFVLYFGRTAHRSVSRCVPNPCLSAPARSFGREPSLFRWFLRPKVLGIPDTARHFQAEPLAFFALFPSRWGRTFSFSSPCLLLFLLCFVFIYRFSMCARVLASVRALLRETADLAVQRSSTCVRVYLYVFVCLPGSLKIRMCRREYLPACVGHVCRMCLRVCVCVFFRELVDLC